MPAASSSAIVSSRMSSCQNGSGREERLAPSSLSVLSACSASSDDRTAGPWSSSSVTRRPYPGEGSSALATLLDLRRLPAQVAQVVQLGATDVTAGHDLDLVDDRGVQREGALDADAEGDLADGERLAHTATVATDDDTLEDLDAGAGALDDLHVDVDGVTGAEGGDVLAQGGLVELVETLHGGFAFFSAPQVAQG